MTQTGLYMVTLSLVLFFASGVGFYFVFKTLTTKSLDKELDKNRQEVLSRFDVILGSGSEQLVFFNKIDIVPVDEIPENNVSFYDSIMPFDASEVEPVRFIRFYASSGNENYEIKIYKSKISSDDLTVRITGLITLLALFFTLGILLLNRFGFRSTWKGFWTSLEKVQAFKAGDHPPAFESTEIDEFEALNHELLKMTGRISRDYHKLESFTSHTTHEFQTPLAVIRSKVELLMQSENLTEEQMKEIQNIDKYAGHLSRLNQSLSLLFKIENQQFGEPEELSIAELIGRHVGFINDQAELRGLKINMNLNKDAVIGMNSSLADILVLNLLRNAMVHNVPDGFVTIDLLSDRLIISNPGKEPENDPDRIFYDFVKGKSSMGLGLGLSIAKKICDQYGISLNYTYKDQIHSFILIFPR